MDMPKMQQLSCYGVYKIVTWSNNYCAYKSNINFAKISTMCLLFLSEMGPLAHEIYKHPAWCDCVLVNNECFEQSLCMISKYVVGTKAN